MSGLRNLCQQYGSIRIQGRLWVWDFAKGEPVPDDEMPKGSERWKESERVRWCGRHGKKAMPAAKPGSTYGTRAKPRKP